jgi:hypothetical protein
MLQEVLDASPPEEAADPESLQERYPERSFDGIGWDLMLGSWDR